MIALQGAHRAGSARGMKMSEAIMRLVVERNPHPASWVPIQASHPGLHANFPSTMPRDGLQPGGHKSYMPAALLK